MWAHWGGITRGFSRRCPTSSSSAIVDINEARAREIGGLVNAPWFTNAAEMLGRVDAVTVAVPTESHLAVALPFLQRGTACSWRSRSRAMPRGAADDRCGRARPARCFGVGHTERYNPAVAAVGRCSTIRDSSRCTGWARFPIAASTSTSSST